MVAREWKCLCPKRTRDGFLAYLYETGVRETSGTAGYRGFEILEREVGERSEFTLITYWESLEAIKAFAGEDIGVAKLYPEDEKYEIISDATVRHYSVIDKGFMEQTG